jgi:hypothetical protein
MTSNKCSYRVGSDFIHRDARLPKEKHKLIFQERKKIALTLTPGRWHFVKDFLM